MEEICSDSELGLIFDIWFLKSFLSPAHFAVDAYFLFKIDINFRPPTTSSRSWPRAARRTGWTHWKWWGLSLFSPSTYPWKFATMGKAKSGKNEDDFRSRSWFLSRCPSPSTMDCSRPRSRYRFSDCSLFSCLNYILDGWLTTIENPLTSKTSYICETYFRNIPTLKYIFLVQTPGTPHEVQGSDGAHLQGQSTSLMTMTIDSLSDIDSDNCQIHTGIVNIGDRKSVMTMKFFF